MKIGLLGYGKMGKEIERLALAAGDEVAFRINRSNESALDSQLVRTADVAIEFSRPENAYRNISLCLESGVPVVAGTTGWLDRMPEAQALCKAQNGALFYAANFSIGVHLFFALNRYLADLMAARPEYRPEMEEIHHTQKLDAPSGTAIVLARDMIDRLPGISGWVNRASDQPSSLPVLSRREGQVPGTHTIKYASAVDTLTIQHEAHSREGFAKGALAAAHWIAGKQGYFEMNDMLGID